MNKTLLGLIFIGIIIGISLSHVINDKLFTNYIYVCPVQNGDTRMLEFPPELKDCGTADIIKLKTFKL